MPDTEAGSLRPKSKLPWGKSSTEFCEMGGTWWLWREEEPMLLSHDPESSREPVLGVPCFLGSCDRIFTLAFLLAVTAFLRRCSLASLIAVCCLRSSIVIPFCLRRSLDFTLFPTCCCSLSAGVWGIAPTLALGIFSRVDNKNSYWEYPRVVLFALRLGYRGV